MIEVTPKAAEELAKLLKEQNPEGKPLRIFMAGFG
jgi:Fe-S cluster assembly iron-binding protein IscA